MSVIKDVYAAELRKQKFERVAGALCLRVALLRKLVEQYQKELDEVNKQIVLSCEEYVNHESK